MLRVLALVGTLALCSSAHAEPNVTVGLQPVFLVVPMVDGTVEYSPQQHIGIAVRAGYGRTLSTLLTTSFYEIGGQANVYLQRNFSGWHLGTELFWLWGDSSSFLFNTDKINSSMSAERVAGVYGGYKWIGWRGLSATIQFGVGRLDQAKSPDGMISEVLPVGNMSVGYSF